MSDNPELPVQEESGKIILNTKELTPEMIDALSEFNSVTIAMAQADAIKRGGQLAELLSAKPKKGNKKRG